MIITGYPGIGKSTLASENQNIIDLESSCFWKSEVDADGHTVRTRPAEWYIYYCQMAEHLSKQGYIVFVSSHKEVREYLSNNAKEKFCAIYPDITMKDEWIQMLTDRYTNTSDEKDLRALKHAQEHFCDDVKDFQAGSYTYIATFTGKNYSLKYIVQFLENN